MIFFTNFEQEVVDSQAMFQVDARDLCCVRRPTMTTTMMMMMMVVVVVVVIKNKYCFVFSTKH